MTEVISFFICVCDLQIKTATKKLDGINVVTHTTMNESRRI